MKAVTTPVLKRFVENIRAKTTDMPYPPTVANGFATYCDSARYSKEVDALESGFLFAGVMCGAPKFERDRLRFEAAT